MALQCPKLICKRAQGCHFKGQRCFLSSNRSTNEIFRYSDLFSDPWWQQHYFYMLYFTELQWWRERIIDARTRRNVQIPYEESWWFSLASQLLGYNPVQKQGTEKIGNFLSRFQVTVHHQGVSEKKPRVKKWSPDPGGVLLILLLPSSRSATTLIQRCKGIPVLPCTGPSCIN